MAIAKVSLSSRSPTRSSSKMPIKQSKALETKKKLLRKRPTDLINKTKKVVSDNKSKFLIRYEPKVAKVSDPGHDLQGKPSVMERAEEVQANLASGFPSFVKLMLPSHVAGGFWLSFPKQFCDSHLPMHDDTVVLVDESEQKYETKYLINKNGLSGGWRGFSIAHKLLEGDVLVFQLIEPCKFKVYIVRVNSLTEIDGAISLLNLDACAKPMHIDRIEKDMKIFETAGDKCLKPLSLEIYQDNIKEKATVVLNTDLSPAADQSGNDSDDFGSEVLEGIRFSQSVVDFKDVKGIDDFNILVDGLIIDSEIPKHLRIKYYELCCGQKSFLHEHLLDGLNCKLAAGIISETVNIADAIKACKFGTSRNNFDLWDKTLKAFEELGMKVEFLRARLNKLASLSLEPQEVMESKILEQVQAEEVMRTTETKLSNVREVIKNLDAEIEALNVRGGMLELMFHEVANAPW